MEPKGCRRPRSTPPAPTSFEAVDQIGESLVGSAGAGPSPRNEHVPKIDDVCGLSWRKLDGGRPVQSNEGDREIVCSPPELPIGSIAPDQHFDDDAACIRGGPLRTQAPRGAGASVGQVGDGRVLARHLAPRERRSPSVRVFSVGFLPVTRAPCAAKECSGGAEAPDDEGGAQRSGVPRRSRTAPGRTRRGALTRVGCSRTRRRLAGTHGGQGRRAGGSRRKRARCRGLPIEERGATSDTRGSSEGGDLLWLPRDSQLASPHDYARGETRVSPRGGAQPAARRKGGKSRRGPRRSSLERSLPGLDEARSSSGRIH